MASVFSDAQSIIYIDNLEKVVDLSIATISSNIINVLKDKIAKNDRT